MTESVDVSTRTAETAMEIGAPADAVWRALTEPAEIVRWFALQSAVEPGTGGTVTWRWADAYRWSTRIELWEPLRRLQLVYAKSAIDDHTDLGAATPDLESGHELVVDFRLESVSGGTWLRCVHSGFGRDAAWDNELEGVRRGWLGELESLRHYLERHPGEDRRVWWAFLNPGVSVADAWRALAPRLRDRRGILEIEADGKLRLGIPGLETELIIVRLDPPGDLVARVPAWNDALVRIGCDPAAENEAMVNVFLSHYGSPVDAERPAARSALLSALREALGAGQANITVLEA